jgi:hypothetical protein
LRKERDSGWPLKIIAPEIEDIVSSSGWEKAVERLMKRLAEDYDRSTVSNEEIAERGWYRRCVYESDNDVCDEQTVTITWDEEHQPRENDEVPAYGRGPKIHMMYPTQAQCERRGRIYGSLGEIIYNSKAIIVHSFVADQAKTHVIPQQAPEVEKSHGQGDWVLAGAFVNAVSAAESGSVSVRDAQKTFIGCDLEEIVRSHAVVFAAEKARQGKMVLDWKEWWTEQKDKFDLK